MNPTPAISEEKKPIPEQFCTSEESQSRLSVCKACEKFTFDANNFTYCLGCGCSINMVITIKSKTCPLGKW